MDHVRHPALDPHPIGGAARMPPESPTNSGRPVWFLLVEDEFGLLEATIFKNVYERYGWPLHHRGRSSWRDRSGAPRKEPKITSGYELVVLFLDQLGAARRAYRASGAGHHPFDGLLNLCDDIPHLWHHRYEAVTTIKAP